ncbi:MAG: hypothetical protein HYX42_10030 [Polaromonas sp.]|uniref:hypothetical protein n=1 Tax=Polaromonas sp. TaxID=1869339 RepID=UPI0025D6F3AA|nr:hypothetical protein [Polaromonas sp.]MBI2726573.1 hypothetical protein [Polaromonas sp.]
MIFEKTGGAIHQLVEVFHKNVVDATFKFSECNIFIQIRASGKNLLHSKSGCATLNLNVANTTLNLSARCTE